MTDLALLSTCVLFISVGLISPFILALGYVWVDTMVPHKLSYGLLSSVPLAFMMGAAAFGVYLALDRRNPPRLSLVHVLVFVMALWISLTTTWAVSPVNAVIKWDVSVKAVLFTAFMPFVFRSRVQIEAFLLVFIGSAAAHLIPWGFKTVLTGGGYGQQLGLLNVNSSTLAESSTVAAVTVMFVPLLLWFRSYSVVVPWQRAKNIVAPSLIVIYLFATIGTFARTGVIALAILGGAMLLRTKRKVLFIAIAVVLGGALYTATSDRWTERISTIRSYESEGSAYTRILIWKWTLGFAVDHPFGGGFNSYVVNVIVGPPGEDGKPTVEYGRAFHNIFFANLGEHGYPGLGIYVTIFALSLLNMQRIIRKVKQRPDLEWLGELARASQLSFAILAVCGNFIDISYNFILWDMIGMMMCLQAYMVRVSRSTADTEEPVPIQRPALLAGAPRPEPVAALSRIR